MCGVGYLDEQEPVVGASALSAAENDTDAADIAVSLWQINITARNRRFRNRLFQCGDLWPKCLDRSWLCVNAVSARETQEQC